MTTNPTEIEGLPPGWEITKIRIVDPTAKREFPDPPDYIAIVTVAETKPRRIVLEETEEERSVSFGDWYEDNEGEVTRWTKKDFGSLCCFKIWRIKEE